MAQVKRFGYGLQALIILASVEEQYSSAEMAEQIRCEPTALRKILSRMTDSGIIEVKQGRGGGYRLAKRPESITLVEVYRSVHEEEPLWDGMLETTENSLLGNKVRGSFDKLMTDIQLQVTRVLESYTLADMME
ncbi:transcriptional regulator, BadM/Rrf2 family [Paenibacillus sophorae]|uniref:HTH-type transcriptional regulator NsrR n=1 Tax=Paenibacillus sophorae TaxID=1333845 RepID=A0A1H8FTK9_9BACL|nr:Rrf2 family transcriptional regulator [Paenibacillus sophorae]QWU13976.1 Rrf2 family transcriptional regulator [Paenibacillus sophorae]SEN35012.1 transcriptional regulator, BadM/Rrf2 family [Paenibacillus sophorae]